MRRIKYFISTFILLGCMCTPIQASNISVNTNGKAWSNTNKTITLTSDESTTQTGVDGSTQYAQSGIKSIVAQTSNGISTYPAAPTVGSKIVTSTMVVNANGDYKITVTDQAGNQSIANFKVNNIDKTRPTATVTSQNTAWTNGQVPITVRLNDAGDATTYFTSDTNLASGVNSYSVTRSGTSVKSGTTTKSNNANSTSSGPTSESFTFNADQNGTYVVNVNDVAGNSNTLNISVTNVDTAIPTLSHTLSETDWTKNDITITLQINDTGGSGIASITKPDGTTETLSSYPNSHTLTFVATTNKQYTFVAADRAGNTKSYSITISKIDKTAPSAINITSQTIDRTTGNVTIEWSAATDTQSGLSGYNIYGRTKTFTTDTRLTMTPSEFYRLQISAIDNVGNETAKTPALNDISIQSIDPIPDIDSIKYTQFQDLPLPNKVTVNTNYGKLDIPIVWEEGTFDFAQGNNTLTGSLQLPQHVYNPNSFRPTINVNLEDLVVGNKDSITNFPKEPNALLRKSVLLLKEVDLSGHSTATVKVNQHGDTKQFPIDWDKSPINNRIPDEYKITGIPRVTDGVVLGSDINVQMYVDVTEPDLTSINAIQSVTIDAYTTFDELVARLPKTVPVTFENDFVADCAITWEQGNFTSSDESLVGVPQTITGVVTLPQYYTNLAHKKASVAVIVESSNLDISGSDSQLNYEITTEFNTEITNQIPSEVVLTLTNGHTVPVQVTYDTTGYDKLSLGEQVFTGEFVNTNLINIGTTPLLKVDVINTTLTDKATVQDIHVPTYTTFDDLGLPTQIQVDYSNGEQDVFCTVDWNRSDYNPLEVGIQTITGTLRPPYGYQGTADFSVSTTATTTEAEIVDVDSSIYIHTDYGTPIDEIAIPTEIDVDLNANQTIKIPVTYNFDAYNPKLVGEQTFLGELDLTGLPIQVNTVDIPSMIINVTQASIKSVESLPNIQAESYTKFNQLGLPDTLEVLFENKLTGTIKTIDCEIVWDDTTYSETLIGTQQLITGEVVLPEGYINTNDIQATVLVELSKTQPTEVKPPQDIIVDYGTQKDQINFPTEVEVTLPSSGEVIKVPVSYDTSTYDPTQLGKQEFVGTITSKDPAIDYSGIEIPNLTIEIQKAEITDIQTQDYEVYGKLGDELVKIFPANTDIAVTLSSGITFKVTPEWNKEDYDFSLEEQTLIGKLTNLPEGITNPNNLTSLMNIHLSADENSTDIIKIPELNMIKVARGTEISNIPYLYRTQALLGSGKYIDIDIAYWDSSNVDTDIIGTHEAIATILPGTFTNTKDIGLKQTIQVVEVGDKDIAQLLPFAPIEIIPGETPKLPTVGNAILGDGTLVEVPVTWDGSRLDTSVPGVNYIEGTISSNNPLNIKPSIEVDIIDLHATNLVITKVLDPDTIYAEVGTPIGKLPIMNSVKVRLSDNRWTLSTPVFDTSVYQSMSLNLQRFKASLTANANYTNPYNLYTNVRVQLFDPNAEDGSGDGSGRLSITKVFNPNNITVVYNTPYTDIPLPQAKVRYSNGIITPIKSPWVLVDYIPHLVGVQTFKGNLNNYYNPNNLEAILDVRVLPDADDVEGKNTIVSIIQPKDITIKKGNALQESKLPLTVKAVLRNGNQIDVEVEWNYSTQSINRSIKIPGQIKLPTGMKITCEPKTSQVVIVKGTSGDGGSGSSGNDNVQPSVPTPIVKEDSDADKLAEAERLKAEQLKKEQAIINNALTQVPYTLPANTLINWSQLIDKTDWKVLNISPATFSDETVVDIRLKTSLVNKSVKSMAIAPHKLNAPNYADVPVTHWAHDPIIELTVRGYSKGTADGNFKPKDYISIADTFTFLDRILVNNGKLKMRNTRQQVDALLTDKDHWSYYNVASVFSKLSSMNVFNNQKADNIYVTELTRQEVANVLHDILTNYEIKSIGGQIEFKDSHVITNKTQVSYCTELGLFKGDNKGNFNPNHKITRAELVSVLLRLDDLLKEQ